MKEYNLNEKALIILYSYEGLEYKHKSAIVALYKKVGEMFENPTPAYSYIAKNLSESLANTFINSACDKQSGYVEFVINKLAKREIEGTLPQMMENF